MTGFFEHFALFDLGILMAIGALVLCSLYQGHA